MEHLDGFTDWHRCARWTRRGLSCPFSPLEDRVESEDEVQAKPFGEQALQAELAREMGTRGSLGLGELVGPLLALFTIVRGIQMLGGLPVGNVSKAGMVEEATTRVLQPRVPAREGPTPARTRPGVPVGKGSSTAPGGRGGGGGFFTNQASELKSVLGGAGFTRK